MAVTYGFYNALNHDRLYDAIQMSSIFDGIIRDGIFSTIGTSMTVTAPEDGLYVNVGPGRAWFNHTWTLNDTEYPVEAEEAEVVLDRIDAVILEVNSAAEVRANSIKFLKGTPASEPVKPTLTHNAEVNQYALAYVRIRAGQSTIFQADVENAVGTEETPFVTGLMQQVSIENLILQWEAEFDDHFENWRNVNEAEFEVWSSDMQDEYNRWILNQVNTYQTWFASIQAEAGDDIDEVMAWFEHMKGQLSEDAAIHLQEEIDALALSAEKGSVVTVHTINQTLYGKNCVISQDGQSRTARFDNTGTAVFESIPYVGQVTITATDGILTAVTYLTIPYFGRYTTNLAFWAATVNISTASPEFFSLPIKVFKDNVLIETISFSALGSVTYIATSEGTYKFSVTYDDADFDHTIEIDEETTYTVVINDWNATLNMQTSVSELYGRGITISKGGVTVGTTTFNGSGRATYKVHEPGTYHIVTSTAGGDTYQADVVVTEETAYPVDLGLPNGRTVLPTDDIQTWLHCAGINDKGYTTLAEVLEDSVTFNALLGDSNACDYMARSATFAGKGEGLVPVMTSATTPSGTIHASVENISDTPPYYAFDGQGGDGTSNIQHFWSDNTVATFVSPCYLQYTFDAPVIVNKVRLVSRWANTFYPKDFTIYGSNDGGVTKVTLLTVTNHSSSEYVYENTFDNNTAYTTYGVDCTSSNAGNMEINVLQFYQTGICDDPLAMSLLGRYDYACDKLLANATWAEAIASSEYFESVLDKKVPIMTSDTQPEGRCFATSLRDSYGAYMAFNGNSTGTMGIYNVATWGIGYEFPEPVKISRVQAGWSGSNLGGFSNWRIQYSDDGINWEYASEDPLVIDSTVIDIAFMPIVVEAPHKYWRLYAPSTSGWTAIRFVNFIGRHSSQNLVPLVPTMTSNTTPSGECFATLTNADAYKIFDGDDSTFWQPSGTSAVDIGYRFTQPTTVKAAYIDTGNYTRISPFKFRGSHDGSTWVDLTDDITYSAAARTAYTIPFTKNIDAYTYYELSSSNSSNTPYIYTLQFYGEAPTSVIHSVPNDTVYYLENGVETTLCTCDSNGVGEVDWSELPQGVMTLYSTTAKDPNNLSNDFSMSIRVTPNKVDAFLIPDRALYWYGWNKNLTHDGFVYSPGTPATMQAPTYNTNSITLASSGGGNYACNVGSKEVVNYLDEAHAIVDVASIAATPQLHAIGCNSSKTYSASMTGGTAWWLTTGMQHITLNVESHANQYAIAVVHYGNAATLYALWTE